MEKSNQKMTIKVNTPTTLTLDRKYVELKTRKNITDEHWDLICERVSENFQVRDQYDLWVELDQYEEFSEVIENYNDLIFECKNVDFKVFDERVKEEV